MKKSLLLVLTFLAIALNTFATDYYVSKSGNNANDGKSISSSFLTIQKASDVAVSGDVVYVRAGVYREAVDIKANGVAFQPYNDEEVTINGADVLTSWSSAGGSTYQTSMAWDMDTYGTNQLFCDGKMIELARWPDQTSSDIVMPTNAKAASATASGINLTLTDPNFNEPNGRWVGAKIWINLAHNGYDGMGWTGTVVATNQAAHTITVDFRGTPRLGDQPWGLGINTEYFLFDPTLSGVNATGGVDALLSNGEWWKNGSTVYVKTPNGVVPSSTGTGNNVIEAKKRHFAFYPSVIRSGYTIKGFNLFACSITTDIIANTLLTNVPYRQVIQENANGIVIDGIKAKYVSHQTAMRGDWQDNHYGYTGIVISGRNNTVKNCTIQYSATSAISITGADHKILNNTIFQTNYMCSNSGTINTAWKNLDSEIANNTIYNTTMMAINFKYSRNSNINIRDKFRIHHNTIYDFMRRSGDSGAIDKAVDQGDWIRIDHNIIYNTKREVGTGSMVHGVYLDYGSPPTLDVGYFTVDHNIIYNVPAPILINSVNDVNVYNNVLISNSEARPIEGATSGKGVKIYNNIMSNELYIRSDNMQQADFKTNIFDATPDKINSFFVNAAGGDFHLIKTATSAIDKGTSIPGYNEANVSGIPDIGALEYIPSSDTQAPSTPTNLVVSEIKNTSFKLDWTASTDNVGVVNYEIFRNGVYYMTVLSNSIVIDKLPPNSTHPLTIRARDAAGNTSTFSVQILGSTTQAVNLAANGTAYRWAGNINATDNTNRFLAPNLNDGDDYTEESLNGGVAENQGWRFEAGGVIFNQSQKVNKVSFVQGEEDINGNAAFTGFLTLQYTINGTTWLESGWDINPVYPYDNSSGSQTFTFSGIEIANVKGVRVSGIVYSTDASWEAILGEVRAFYIVDVVPITLADFSGKATNMGNELKWRTSSEKNNKNFELLRSVNGKDFTAIASINSLSNNGNSNSELSYSYIDKDYASENYYKLKQIDFDGKSVEFSKVVYLKNNLVENDVVDIYPNPVLNDLNISLTLKQDGKLTLTLTNLLGQTILQKNQLVEKGKQTFKIDFSKYNSGIYILSIKNDVGKLILTKNVAKK